MFPLASEYFTPLIYTLSIIAIIYTSLIALMQDDMKKLIAYSSVAHMGYVTLGIFTLTKQGIEGGIYQMISHGLISAALFLCVGVVYDRLHSRMISTYGGLVNYIPKYSFFIFTIRFSSVRFTWNFRIFRGISCFNWNISKKLCCSYACNICSFRSCLYAVAYKRVIFGVANNSEIKNLNDINKSEIVMLVSLAFLILFFWFLPSSINGNIQCIS